MPSSFSAALRLPAALALFIALFAGLLVTASPARAATATLGQRAVAEAAKHKGKPYQYGATGPDRFDCSGYTMYVFSRLGKKIPRTSNEQYTGTRLKVARSAKQTGDLIFMRNSSGRITHVGIYAGSNKWWVSPKSGDVVKLQTLYSTNYSVARVV